MLTVRDKKRSSTPKKRGVMRQDRLRELIAARELTHEELAKKSKISKRQITRYLSEDPRERQDPTFQAITAIAKVLECSLDYLAGLSDDVQGRIFEKDLTPAQRRVLMAYRASKDPLQKFRDIVLAVASDEELLPKGEQ